MCIYIIYGVLVCLCSNLSKIAISSFLFYPCKIHPGVSCLSGSTSLNEWWLICQSKTNEAPVFWHWVIKSHVTIQSLNNTNNTNTGNSNNNTTNNKENPHQILYTFLLHSDCSNLVWWRLIIFAFTIFGLNDAAVIISYSIHLQKHCIYYYESFSLLSGRDTF